jgi:purine-nucleoside phosphorylase
VAIILGTGLGQFAEHVEVEAVVPYREIPDFPQARGVGHAGRLVCGVLAGVPVVVFEGRCHRYEGYSRDELTLPVRVAAQLGARHLVVTNASGGLDPKFAGGDILLIDDHVDLMFGRTTATGRAPELRSYYDASHIQRALAIARRENFVAHRGVYVALAGPNYETRAEYRYLRQIGGDAVGMSTVPEVLAAAACGLRVLALSVITNVARPDAPRKTTAEEVVAIAHRAEPKLRQIVAGVIADLATPGLAAP